MKTITISKELFARMLGALWYGATEETKQEAARIMREAPDDASPMSASERNALHDHIRHLRSMIYPPRPQDSAAWRPMPVKHLMAIQTLIDPTPMVIDGKTMVFVNPMAAETLTAISAEVRAMLAAQPPTEFVPIPAAMIAPNDALIAAMKLAKAHLDISMNGNDFQRVVEMIDAALIGAGATP